VRLSLVKVVANPLVPQGFLQMLMKEMAYLQAKWRRQPDVESFSAATSQFLKPSTTRRAMHGKESSDRHHNHPQADLVTRITKHLKKGERICIVGLGILQVRRRAARIDRPRHRRGDPDQGEQGRSPSARQRN
jgi:hypothetical protein